MVFFFQAEDGIRDYDVTGVQTCALPISVTPRKKSVFAEHGMSLGVSSWRRLSDNASPPRIKATANYHNARLAVHEAKLNGYDGALMLTPDDYVSEAPIACFFMVRDGKLITPSCSSNILEGITRDTIITRRSEEHTSELQSRRNIVCRLLLEKNPPPPPPTHPVFCLTTII